jgi:hypothetical protein
MIRLSALFRKEIQPDRLAREHVLGKNITISMKNITFMTRSNLPCILQATLLSILRSSLFSSDSSSTVGE